MKCIAVDVYIEAFRMVHDREPTVEDMLRHDGTYFNLGIHLDLAPLTSATPHNIITMKEVDKETMDTVVHMLSSEIVSTIIKA